ncbi:3-oxoacyl-[acyl-carrier-protein] synthase 3 [Acholeplasma oculi]|uniref:Beta-ketoacyl-[acyl-carrier-protein] synthase III n=1 Tax=Acholeplasma oculi TaxID=35623 RepID=A0A061A9U5_9MOLU|nr:beta-ketoacyl-ACP synthase III [Acholeplasma oculi]CDR30675.1 3-oxoacyl-[acyl-carrier-protein] synthase 3 [Acholeplasma oculi]SKC34637.1 3-oxoacyl-[acyl-carrier-protein] synthase-3 [Acholeplasma oculi]SUT89465.1 3-oxoacyl-[acyl-carrier-protein] synthase 3 [Acholeplasma oculi]
MKQIPIKLISTGRYAPTKVMTNEDFSKILDTNDEWITTRTGIKRRHIAETETAIDMAYEAALKAIEKVNFNKEDIELIIVASITSPVKTPSIANLVQAKLGLNHKNIVAFDLNAACSGFVYALEVASSMLSSGIYKSALVIGSEHMSSILDWTDRSTAILFGDGAGAAIIEPSTDVNDSIFFFNGSRGDDTGILWINPKVQMEGREVYKFAVDIMPKAIDSVLKRAKLSLDDIDVIIPHQANLRIIQSVAKDMGLPLDRFLINLDEYGNTSSASIPILLDEYKDKNKEKKKALLIGFGGGFTWGASILNI